MAQELNILFPLDEFYVAENRPLPVVSRIRAADVPEPYRRLLVGHHDMTPTLEAFHGDRIEIQVIERTVSTDTLGRIVVLLMEGSSRPVEFGAIIIHLNLVPPEARGLILEGHSPFGSILANFCIQHVSRPQAFIRVEPDALMADALGLSGPHTLYGRRNVLLTPHNEVLADIVEVLPP
jgi:hypothetical protein